MAKNINVNQKTRNIFIPIIISALFSGLLSVFLMNYLNERNEMYNKKLETLVEFVANRYDITGVNFTQALNKAFILFNDSEEVLKAIKNFHDNTQLQNRTTELSNQRLLEIFKAMCEELDINIAQLNDNFFLMPFNIRR